eukprot:Nk52_evm50s266 gene=Nk52_evmTU50s266
MSASPRKASAAPGEQDYVHVNNNPSQSAPNGGAVSPTRKRSRASVDATNDKNNAPSTDQQDGHLLRTRKSSNGPSPTVKKAKVEEGSKTLTETQIEHLEQYFVNVNQNPTADDRTMLAAEANLTVDQVKNWFSKRKASATKSAKKGSKAAPPEKTWKQKAVEFIQLGNVPALKAVMFPEGEPVQNNRPLDDEGHTAVHWAAALGQYDVLVMLEIMGEDLTIQNETGENALHRAGIWPHCYTKKSFERILLMLCDNANVASKGGHVPLQDIAFILADDSNPDKLYFEAAEYYIYTICDFVKKGKIDLNINYQDPDGDTAFSICVETGSKRIALAMLEAGANPDLANKEGKTSYEYATKEVKKLIDDFKSGKPIILENPLVAPAPKAKNPAKKTPVKKSTPAKKQTPAKQSAAKQSAAKQSAAAALYNTDSSDEEMMATSPARSSGGKGGRRSTGGASSRPSRDEYKKVAALWRKNLDAVAGEIVEELRSAGDFIDDLNKRIQVLEKNDLKHKQQGNATAALEEENQRLKGENGALKRQADSAEKQLEAKVSQMQKTIDELRRSLADAGNRKDSGADGMKATLDALKRELESVKKESQSKEDGLRSELKAAKDEVARMNIEMNETREKYEKQLEAATKELSEMEASMSEEILRTGKEKDQSAQRELSALQANLSNAERRASETTNALRLAEAKIHELQAAANARKSVDMTAQPLPQPAQPVSNVPHSQQ